jgi:AraC-like DNA-binding protein
VTHDVRANDLVPTQFAASLARMLIERGLDPAQSTQAAGIGFDVLDPAAPGYLGEIPALAYSRLYRRVMTALQDETFGLRRDVGMRPGAFRMMCYCLLGCANLARAIARICEFHQVFYYGQMDMRLVREGESARFEIVVSPRARAVDCGAGTAVPMSSAAAACALSMWHRFFGWLVGHPLPLDRVELSGSPPANLARYRQLFNCELQFGVAIPAFVFPADFLAYPLVHNEDSLRDFLRTAPYQLLTMPADPGKQRLVDQVRALIGHDFSRGFPSFERITELLHMSAPTLRRRLKREGTTFQELKDSCRREAAIDYLNRPELSITDVAILMGFTDPSAFYRSFKKWTGMTPGEHRALEAR